MIEYIIDKEEQKVTAVITECSLDAIKKIEKIMRTRYGIFLLPYEMDKYMMCDTYSGTVKCYGDDIFDEEVGKKLAAAKVKSHHRHAYNKMLYKFITNMFDARVDIENYLDDRLMYDAVLDSLLRRE